jgi:HprK-related kinase A
VPGSRFQFRFGRLELAVESANVEFNQVFRALYRVADAEPSDIVPDLVFQLRQESHAEYRWVVDGQPVDQACSSALALAHFEWAMHDALTIALLPAVTVHAAVAVNAAGDGVAMVGMSGSGKSTLVAGLVADGWSLFSDEFFVVEPAGDFVPMPGVVSLKGAAIELIRSRSDDLIFSPTTNDPFRGPIAHLSTTRVATIGSAFALRAIFFPQFSAGTARAVTRLDAAAAFFRIADQSHNFYLHGPVAFHQLVALARLPSFALEFGDLEAGLDAVRSVVQP